MWDVEDAAWHDEPHGFIIAKALKLEVSFPFMYGVAILQRKEPGMQMNV